MVAFDPYQLSPNQRIHWRERARRNTVAATAAYIGWIDAGRPEFTCRVVVDVILPRAPRLDPDNAVACLKGLIDGLFRRRRNCYGVTEDDSEKCIELGTVTQVSGAIWKGIENAEFVIRPAQD